MQATGPSTDLAAIQEKIVGKRFVDALGDLDTVLQTDPDHRDALYMRAVCCRYLRRFEQAQVTLDKLKTLAPDHSRAHQEEGHTYRDWGKPDDALRATPGPVRSTRRLRPVGADSSIFCVPRARITARSGCRHSSNDCRRHRNRWWL